MFHRLIARLLSTFNTAWLAGLAARSAAELQAEMHKLRGSASLLGAARVDQLAAEAEARLRQGGLPDEVRPQLDALAEALVAKRDKIERSDICNLKKCKISKTSKMP